MLSAVRRFFELSCLIISLTFWVAGTSTILQASQLEDGRAAINSGNYDKAMEILQPLAESGDSVAQNAMGVLYLQGWGVDPDPERAAGYFQLSARQGNAKGAMNLAYAYQTGMGVESSCIKAHDLLEPHAQGGNAKAQVALGVLYDQGCPDFSSDPKKAFLWYSAAAGQDDPIGLGNVGAMYALGLGVEKNYTEAMKHYRKAATLGNGKAALNLGRMYEFGEGMPPDPELAQHWYHEAVALGEVEAEQRLMVLEQGGNAANLADTDLFAEALKVPPLELAQSYGSISNVLAMFPLVEAGVTLQLPDGEVNKGNIAVVRRELEQRATIYERAIEERGSSSISGEYIAKAKKCSKSGSAWAMSIAKGYDRVFVVQKGSEVAFEASKKRPRNDPDVTAAGFCVENAISLIDPMNSDYVLVGEFHNGQITIRPDAESIIQAWPDFIKPPKRTNLVSCIVTLDPAR